MQGRASIRAAAVAVAQTAFAGAEGFVADAGDFFGFHGIGHRGVETIRSESGKDTRFSTLHRGAHLAAEGRDALQEGKP